jgi:transcriptional regulator with XRE-family HTH domain
MRKSIYSDDYQHFLLELRNARVSAGFSQEQLAAALGAHQTLVSKVERGVRRLDVIELRLWLLALGRTFPEFCGQLDSRLARHGRLPLARRPRS